MALRVTFQRERGLSLSFKAHCPGVFAAGSCWDTGNVELAGSRVGGGEMLGEWGTTLLPHVLTATGPSPRCYRWAHCSYV